MSADPAAQPADMGTSPAIDNRGRCLICNTLQTPGADCAALADPVGPDCSVDACLSAVLRLPLLSLVDCAAVVCSVCFRLLQEIFSLDLRGWTLRRSVRANFSETYRGNVPRRQEGGRDPVADVARRLEEVDAEDKLGFMSAGAVNGRCERCDRAEASAAASARPMKRVDEGQKHAEESIVQVEVIHMRRPAKRSRLVQTGGSDPAVSAQSEQSTGVATEAVDHTSGSPGPTGAPSPVTNGRSTVTLGRDSPDAARSDGGDEADDPGDPVDPDCPGQPTAAETTAERRVLRRRRRRRSPSPTRLSEEDDPRDGADPAAEGHQCEVCGTECSDAAELSRHRDACAPAVLWSCALCGRAFRHLPQLKRHTRQHQLPTRQLAVCFKCGVVCPGEAALAEHAVSHAPDAADIRICGFCGLGFWAETDLTAHSATHTATCSVCHKQLRKDSMREHMRRHTGETPYGCDECGKRFVAFSSLRAHRRTHTGDKPHKCHLCSEMFHLKQSLAEHLERHENKTVHCEVCGREFPSSRRLAAHVKTHDKRRWQPHTCEFCGDGFMTKRSLRAHRARHTGPLPFTCDVCGKGFTYEDTYKEHISVHSGQRPYTCEVCGKSYGRRSCLWAHRNQHTNPGRFSCGHCGKQFTSQSAYNVHLRIHTGERPYRCSTCSASFRLLSTMKRHSETCVSGICPPPADVTPAGPAAPVAPVATVAPAALVPPAAPVTPAAVPAAPIQVQLSTPGGGTAQIQLPAVPPLYDAPWQPPPPPPAGGGVAELSLPEPKRL